MVPPVTSPSNIVEDNIDDFEPFSKPCERCGKTIGYNGKEVCKVQYFYKHLIIDTPN